MCICFLVNLWSTEKSFKNLHCLLMRIAKNKKQNNKKHQIKNNLHTQNEFRNTRNDAVLQGIGHWHFADSSSKKHTHTNTPLHLPESSLLERAGWPFCMCFRNSLSPSFSLRIRLWGTIPLPPTSTDKQNTETVEGGPYTVTGGRKMVGEGCKGHVYIKPRGSGWSD